MDRSSLLESTPTRPRVARSARCGLALALLLVAVPAIAEADAETSTGSATSAFYAVNLLPFGTGQFARGDTTTGYALLTSQLALGISSLTLWSYLEVTYRGGAKYVPDREADRAQAISTASIVLGALFWADVAGGIIDALVRSRSSRGSRAVRAHLDPLPTAFGLPGGGGLAVQGVF